jgi:hypothetical protein
LQNIQNEIDLTYIVSKVCYESAFCKMDSNKYINILHD